MELSETNPLAVALKEAIHSGDTNTLEQMLAEHPELATTRFVDEKGVGREALNIAADWPGHFPNVANTIAMLIRAGANPNSGVSGAGYHSETPLHGAASSDDVEALDALLDGGADIEHPGAVFTNGTAMSDAVIFENWKAARRLLERGAKTTFTQAAALGLQDRVEAIWNTDQPTDQVTAALWHACKGGQQAVAQFMLDRGADLNWLGWDHMTPLDAAIKGGNQDLVQWLLAEGAHSAR